MSFDLPAAHATLCSSITSRFLPIFDSITYASAHNVELPSVAKEDDVPRQQHEGRYAQPMVIVFASLNRVLAKHRWGVIDRLGEQQVQPKVGCRYARQSRSVLRRGRVLEVIRPVSLTLYETLHDPPCRVRLQLRWRLHPIETGSLLHLTLSYQLNGAASLRQRHWHERLQAHCLRMLQFVATDLERVTPETEIEVYGARSQEKT